MMKTVKLNPADCRKSFYGKASAIVTDTAAFLRSYETIVAKVENGTITRYWAGRSATTDRHLKAFFEEFGGDMATYKAATAEPWYNVPEEVRRAAVA